MAILNDTTVPACICRVDEKTKIPRDTKRRVSSWLGCGALLGFIVVLLTYPEFLVSETDFAGWILLLLIAYYFIGVPYKTYIYIKDRHTLKCALRRAALEVI